MFSVVMSLGRKDCVIHLKGDLLNNYHLYAITSCCQKSKNNSPNLQKLLHRLSSFAGFNVSLQL